MQIKYFLLVLMVVYSQKIASSHILTSAYLDMSLPACKRLLTFAVMNDLCPTYGDYSSDYMPPMALELQEEYKENIIKKCCTNPCTLTELIAIC
ncbi:unnamed protein product [Arctia plantaginis]|uniref:Uncharacterized protein n=1 Tax=Arctia plantaginis TaxID=874455 RepID=A0A8S1BIR4_ARCPL|nr:unnamed protein product [Arctia plantaginis]CAB3260345.1 unnamed protein product [Arctia plantaginis]